jgi:hypothetical protein
MKQMKATGNLSNRGQLLKHSIVAEWGERKPWKNLRAERQAQQ